MRVKVKGKWYDVDMLNSRIVERNSNGIQKYYFIKDDKLYYNTQTYSYEKQDFVNEEILIGEIEEDESEEAYNKIERFKDKVLEIGVDLEKIGYRYFDTDYYDIFVPRNVLYIKEYNYNIRAYAFIDTTRGVLAKIFVDECILKDKIEYYEEYAKAYIEVANDLKKLKECIK